MTDETEPTDAGKDPASVDQKIRNPRKRVPPPDAETTKSLDGLLAALRRERIMRGITIQQVANHLTTTQSTIVSMERGMGTHGNHANPSMLFVTRWARLFGLQVRLVVDCESIELPKQRSKRTTLSRKEQLVVMDWYGKASAAVVAEKYKVSVTTIYHLWKVRRESAKEIDRED